jgi:exopolysaccharide production protein ExoQ
MTVPTRRATTAPNRSRNQSMSLLITAIAWIMIILMIVPGNLDYTGNAPSDEGGNPITRALWIALLAFGTTLALSRLSLTARLSREINVFIVLFVGLVAASVVWSIDPEQTVRSIVRMMATYAAAIAFAVVAWNPRRFQQVVRPVLTIMLAGSIVFGLIRPDLAIHQEQSSELLNAWHGLFQTKNSLGAGASFSFILWAHAWLTRETNRASALFGMCIAVTCLILSRSSTSSMATVLSLLTLLMLVRTPTSMRRAMPYLASGLVILILLYSLAMLKVVPGLEMLLAPIPMLTGKDLTFSNRAEIWAAVVNHVKIRPLLGSGYSAYWIQGTPTPDMEAYAIKSQLQGFYPGSAHNGYLQILNDLGAVGLFCLLGYLFVYVRQSIRLYRIDRTQGALFLALFLQQATINLTEPFWLNVLRADFVLMLLATTCLARSLLDATVNVRRVPNSSVPRMRTQNYAFLRYPRGPSKRKLHRPIGTRGDW